MTTNGVEMSQSPNDMKLGNDAHDVSPIASAEKALPVKESSPVEKMDVSDDTQVKESAPVIAASKIDDINSSNSKNEPYNADVLTDKGGAEAIADATTEMAKPPTKEAKQSSKTTKAASKSERPAKSAASPKKEDAKPAASQPKSEKAAPKRKATETAAIATPSGEKSTPLLEAPLTTEGKRMRRTVDRLASEVLSPQRKDLDVPEGKGMKLGDIEFVEHMLTHTKPDDLKVLHRICFGRAGTVHEVRKNLRQFCGFGFAKDSVDYTKKLTQINNQVVNALKKVCEVLGLERSGTKEKLSEEVASFLVAPTDVKRTIPKSKSKRKSGGSSKRKSAGGSKKKKAGASKSSRSGATKSDDAASSSGSDSASEAENDDEKASSDEEDTKQKKEESEEPPNKKAATTSQGKKAAVPPKKADKKEKTVTQKKVDVDADEEPATSSAASKSKKGAGSKSPTKSDTAGRTTRGSKSPEKPAGAPTNAQLKATIKELLDGADLEKVTMKTMCKQVYAKYPGHDLTPRKEFIKSTVRSLISVSDEDK